MYKTYCPTFLASDRANLSRRLCPDLSSRNKLFEDLDGPSNLRHSVIASCPLFEHSSMAIVGPLKLELQMREEIELRMKIDLQFHW